jgi:hypothetical protein
MPIPMLVVAAVLDAAMATPSTTLRERRRPGGSLLIRTLLKPEEGREGAIKQALSMLRQWC